MKLKIEINLNHAAFEFPGGGAEVARILRKLADRMDGEQPTPGDVTPCMDCNGNRVGEARVI